MQDVRGRWMSEGVFKDVRPFNPDKKMPSDVDEASDAYAFLTITLNLKLAFEHKITVSKNKAAGFLDWLK